MVVRSAGLPLRDGDDAVESLAGTPCLVLCSLEVVGIARVLGDVPMFADLNAVEPVIGVEVD